MEKIKHPGGTGLAFPAAELRIQRSVEIMAKSFDYGLSMRVQWYLEKTEQQWNLNFSESLYSDDRTRRMRYCSVHVHEQKKLTQLF